MGGECVENTGSEKLPTQGLDSSTRGHPTSGQGEATLAKWRDAPTMLPYRQDAPCVQVEGGEMGDEFYTSLPLIASCILGLAVRLPLPDKSDCGTDTTLSPFILIVTSLGPCTTFVETSRGFTRANLGSNPVTPLLSAGPSTYI